MTARLISSEADPAMFLIVTLTVIRGEQPKVHRVEQSGSDPHVSYSFTSAKPIESIFRHAFADRLQDIVAMRNGIGSLLHLPDFSFRLGGLRLETCQILVSKSRSALEHIIVRFRRVAGHLREVMSAALTGTDSTLNFTRIAASKCLLDIICPLRDIGHHIDRLEADGTLEKSGETGDALRAIGRRIGSLEVPGDEVALNLRALDPSGEADWPSGRGPMLHVLQSVPANEGGCGSLAPRKRQGDAG